MATTTKKPAATPAKKAPAKAASAPAKVVIPVAAKKTAAKAVVAKPVTQAARPVKAGGAPQTRLKASTAPKPVMTVEQRNHYVSVAAFYIAERRGFTLGNPGEDWIAAEAEIERLIASGHFTA